MSNYNDVTLCFIYLSLYMYNRVSKEEKRCQILHEFKVNAVADCCALRTQFLFRNAPDFSMFDCPEAPCWQIQIIQVSGN